MAIVSRFDFLLFPTELTYHTYSALLGHEIVVRLYRAVIQLQLTLSSCSRSGSTLNSTRKPNPRTLSTRKSTDRQCGAPYLLILLSTDLCCPPQLHQPWRSLESELQAKESVLRSLSAISHTDNLVAQFATCSERQRLGFVRVAPPDPSIAFSVTDPKTDPPSADAKTDLPAGAELFMHYGAHYPEPTTQDGWKEDFVA